MRRLSTAAGPVLVLLLVLVAACAKKPPVVRATPPPPPPATAPATSRPPAPPEPVSEPTVVPAEPVRDDAISSASLDDLNRSSPLRPVFYEYDSSDLSADGQRTLDANAAVLKQYATWAITIEGRLRRARTAEYNLGERRAVTARAYLISLGISADRLRTVSYGKEFPFDPGHEEPAFIKNRRAHFVITAK